MEKTELLAKASNATSKSRYVLIIHGGAGNILRERSTPEQQEAYRSALSKALKAGHRLLSEGRDALDAVVAAVTVMEDNPLFNSGKGAVFNVDGKNELEASLMVSRPPHSHPDIPSERRGMGLTLLTRAKNPSHLVRALYLSPTVAPHPFLSGHTAEALGESLGETLVDPSYFFTDHRWKEHRRGLDLPEETLPGHEPDAQPGTVPPLDQLPTGTVGAVALDMYGCIACLTSTGGRTNKLVGRIGDTPHMGSGFWAEEWSEPSMFQTLMKKMFRRSPPTRGIGISGTGDGDFFIRQATAATIAHRVRYLGESLDKASSAAVESLRKDGGIGGVIVLDTEGNFAMPLNCPGMYRGVIREDGRAKTAIFQDEALA